MLKKIIVAKDGAGDFDTLCGALDSIADSTDNAEIFLKNGFYFEKVVIDRPNVTIKGEDKNETVIVYNDCALRKNEKGEYLGTFATATLEIGKNAVNTVLDNITVQNSAGYGKVVGQAVALNAAADRTVVKNCRLIARQDTLMLWPGFREALEDPGIYTRCYFENCYIEGDVDFIFGGATAVFKNCDIYCKHRPTGYDCFITAACTPADIKYGFVFFDCRIDGDAEKGTAYLGRPWTEGARTVFINTAATDVLNRSLWSKWNKNRLHDAAFYAQNSFDAGFDIPEWTRLLTNDEVKDFTLENIFKDWIPV